ncbi:hypothetical protein Tco_1347098 [Tanacetum coccineum]
MKNSYLICDYCGGSHEADECKQTNLAEQVCLSGGDIYDDPSLPRFYQNDDTPPWGNNKHKEKGEDGPEWIVRSMFEDELTNFMLEKKSNAKRIRDMLDQHRKELYEQFFQILLNLMSHLAKAETRGVTSWVSSQHNGVNNKENYNALDKMILGASKVYDRKLPNTRKWASCVLSKRSL